MHLHQMALAETCPNLCQLNLEHKVQYQNVYIVLINLGGKNELF